MVQGRPRNELVVGSNPVAARLNLPQFSQKCILKHINGLSSLPGPFIIEE